MRDEWKKYKLRDVANIIDSLHKTPDYSEFGFPMVRVTDIKEGFLSLENALYVSKEVYEEFSKKHISEKGDIVFSRVGSYGIASYVNTDNRFCLGQNTVFILPNINRRFFYYSLIAPSTKKQIERLVVGSTQKTISLKSIGEIEFYIPNDNTQTRIASIFSSFDDKIELNRKMNETLEAIARALFKSWFVDFNPVRAKMEGRQPAGMDEETTALFPDSFEESELGEIPKGWRVGKLSEIGEHIRRNVQPNKIEPEIPYIALEHMPRFCIALSDWGNSNDLESNKFQFKKGEILFGKLRPYFHKVGVAPVDGICSTDIVVMAPKSEKWFGILLGHVSSNEFVEYTNAGSTGTKMPRTNWNDMAKFEIVLPPEKLAGVFTENMKPAIKHIIQSIHESRNLAQIRDTLLPKLLSGEIQVREAEKAVEKAVEKVL
ncbi:MAG: restriction endonuclease subunit S [Candidatus Eremiobacteraeota bacterium]|nr:restriction endonuclease subunit S [Candidatus Eremiobacteraeota bacterium]